MGSDHYRLSSMTCTLCIHIVWRKDTHASLSLGTGGLDSIYLAVNSNIVQCTLDVDTFNFHHCHHYHPCVIVASALEFDVKADSLLNLLDSV